MLANLYVFPALGEEEEEEEEDFCEEDEEEEDEEEGALHSEWLHSALIGCTPHLTAPRIFSEAHLDPHPNEDAHSEDRLASMTVAPQACNYLTYSFFVNIMF
jgi:hypothetical protein